jgi:transcriptional regulator with XRE-family HTH domain
MGVAVYPKLSELLRANNLTVAELGRQIERRFGMSVDPKTLYRLAHADPVQRADLEIAGAAAAVLGVGLDDLFAVEATPVDDDEDSLSGDLDPAQSRRLAELFDRQARETLSEVERQEIEGLVSEYGRRVHERRLQELAKRRGMSVEETRREVAAQFDQALEWWRAFEAEPAREAAVVERASRHRPDVAE